jgi:thioredoxin reductase (NADPH)
MSALFDCVVIEGTPAGLLGAVYLARFRRSTLLVDSGKSRARWIPKTRNVPGYPRGIAGPNLLARLREQLACYNVARESGSVDAVSGTCGDFALHGDSGSWRARRVILATGVKDNIPHDLQMLWALVPQGRVRLCPVCDAYELCGKRIGVLSRTRRSSRGKVSCGLLEVGCVADAREPGFERLTEGCAAGGGHQPL